jgi:hypothetical protein
MKDLLEDLIEKQDRQRESLSEILKILEEEREILKKAAPEGLPGLLVRLQEASAQAMRADFERSGAASALASAMGCPSSVREFCSRLPQEDSARLKASAGNLLEVVLAIKECSFILNRQASEHRFLGSILLDRLRGAGAGGMAAEGAGLDTKA